MFTEFAIPAHLVARPASFASLMELYECNYIEFRRLCPQPPRRLPQESVSRLAGGDPLTLRVLERQPYTTTLNLSQRISENGRTPSLPLRIYHDARQAEVLMAGVHPAGLAIDRVFPPVRRGLDLCWQANLFLNEWLRYCLRQGHRFGPHP